MKEMSTDFKLTLFPTAFFFCSSHGGGVNLSPMENIVGSVSTQFTVTYTNPRGHISSFKTLKLRATQLDELDEHVENSKNPKVKVWF
jgi:hypothetical protein